MFLLISGWLFVLIGYYREMCLKKCLVAPYRDKKMTSNRKVVIVVGALFIYGYANFFLSEAISGPIIGSPEYLNAVYPNKTKVILAVLVELLLIDMPIVGMRVLLFPILKKISEGFALWYAATRVIEAVTLVTSKASTLFLITLSQEYISAGAPDGCYFEISGAWQNLNSFRDSCRSALSSCRSSL